MSYKVTVISTVNHVEYFRLYEDALWYAYMHQQQGKLAIIERSN